MRRMWGYVTVIAAIHLLSLLALVPWLFSWTGLVLFIAGHYFFGMLGMTLGYHRLLTHRGFTCPKWLEHFLRYWAFAACRIRRRVGLRCIASIINTPTRKPTRIVPWSRRYGDISAG